MSSTAYELAVDLTESIANYMRAKFKASLAGSNESVPFPSHWRLALLQESNRIVDILVQATHNKKQTSWKVGDYTEYLKENCPRATGQNSALERRISQKFEPITQELSMETRPLVVIDKIGNILVWYLPHLLSPEWQISLWNGLDTIQNSFTVNKWSTSWRINETYYQKKEDCRFQPGTVSVSPAWFQQAHSKSNKMEVSAELRKEQGLKWISEITETSAILGGALAIIHPQLFMSGITAMKTLNAHPDLVNKGEDLLAILQVWSSPFSGLSVMNNRQTPYHRDNGGEYCSMDLLATVGPYKKGWMDMPGLGFRLRYNAGTVVAVAGRVVVHGAEAEGERACFAYYMRENIMKELHVEEPGWANIAGLAGI